MTNNEWQGNPSPESESSGRAEVRGYSVLPSDGANQTAARDNDSVSGEYHDSVSNASGEYHDPADSANVNWSASPAPERPFVFTRYEGIAALLTYVLAFLYTYVWTEFFFADGWPKPIGQILTAVFVLLFLVVTELVHRDVPRPKESWFWLACTLVTAAAAIFGKPGVIPTISGEPHAWGEFVCLFLHAFAVYYALSRSGKLLERSSGAYVVIDGWHAFLGWPFRYFFRKVRTAFRFLFGAGEKPSATEAERKENTHRLLWAIPALVLGALLLAAATNLLRAADNTFAEFTEKFRFSWRLDDIGKILLRLVLSLPVGAFIFGSLDGARQTQRQTLDTQKEGTDRFLGSLSRVPAGLWIFILALFTLVYAAFFVIQGRYLFSALFGELPAGFTASSYARQGFFELCKVMVVNFALLWLVHFTSEKRPGESVPIRASLTLLMAESCLLAVTALSKLVLYISRFGITPLRIQSSWLVVVLLLGSVLYLIRLWTGKKTFRIWLIVSCGLLAVSQLL